MQLHTIMHEGPHGPQRSEFYSEHNGSIADGMAVFVNEANGKSLCIPVARIFTIDSVGLDEG